MSLSPFHFLLSHLLAVPLVVPFVHFAYGPSCLRFPWRSVPYGHSRLRRVMTRESSERSERDGPVPAVPSRPKARHSHYARRRRRAKPEGRRTEGRDRAAGSDHRATPTLPVLRHSVHSPYVSLTSCLRACKEGGVTKNEERGADDKDERHEG